MSAGQGPDLAVWELLQVSLRIVAISFHISKPTFDKRAHFNYYSERSLIKEKNVVFRQKKQELYQTVLDVRGRRVRCLGSADGGSASTGVIRISANGRTCRSVLSAAYATQL